MKYNMGDPLDPSVNLGPLARRDILGTLKLQIRQTSRLGAKLVYGDIKQIDK